MSCVTSAVRFIPSGVISKFHEMTTATMKPSASKMMNAFNIQDGASRFGKKIHASSISSHATTA